MKQISRFGLFSLTLAGLALANGASAQDTQRFNLYGATDVQKFPLSQDLVWPDEVGEAQITLWSGDKYAALTITIDDNIPQDHAWWLEKAEQYDLELTWFVITQNISDWSIYQALVDAGHSVQSHTVTHGALDYDGEYGPSQEAINNNITGQWAGTIAYPGGTAYDPRPDLAKDFYIGGRGVVGTPNKANSINYMQTSSSSSRIDKDYLDSILFGRSSINWLNNTSYLRGWLCSHFHFVQNKPTIEADLEYLDSHRDLVWVDSFYDVIRFVQERDTATLDVTKVAWNEIRFELTDWMDDSIYDFPLTIKVRIPNEWTGVTATQNNQPIDAQIVMHENNQYILVDAVPDRGEVVIAGEGGVEPDTEAPTSPTNVTVSDIGHASARISWDAATDNVGVVSYDIYLGDNLHTSVAGLEVTLTNLSPATQYTVVVSAVDAAGNDSGLDTSIQFTTLSNPATLHWGGMPADVSGHIDTGAFLGWLNITYTPWLWSYQTNGWLYAPDPGAGFTGTWIHFQRQ